MRTIIEFELIKTSEDNYFVDAESFSMDGSINWQRLHEFLFEDKTWHKEVWNYSKWSSLDSHAKTIVMSVYMDSDDDGSWLEYEQLQLWPEPTDSYEILNKKYEALRDQAWDFDVERGFLQHDKEELKGALEDAVKACYWALENTIPIKNDGYQDFFNILTNGAEHGKNILNPPQPADTDNLPF